jgi:DnaJ-class molecular chaperone
MPGNLLAGGRAHCPDCEGTGECPRCFGSCENVALNSDQDTCPYCKGTGACPTCSAGAETIITLGLSG